MLKIKYRVLKIERGLLVQPQYSHWQGFSPLFKDGDTQEECLAALNEVESCPFSEYVILPITYYVCEEFN